MYQAGSGLMAGDFFDVLRVGDTRLAAVIGDVSGRSVLLVDDIIDTAGSVVAAIEELKDRGATDITVACAHPVLSGPAWDRLTKVAKRAAEDFGVLFY